MFKKKRTPFKELQEKIGLIYVETPAFKDGALVKVIDRDPDDGTLYVSSLEQVLAAKGDVERLMKGAKMVKPEFITFLDFEKPKKSLLKPLSYIATLAMGLFLGTHLELILGL